MPYSAPASDAFPCAAPCSASAFITVNLNFLSVLLKLTVAVCPLTTVMCCASRSAYSSGVSSVTVYSPGAKLSAVILPPFAVLTVLSIPFPLMRNVMPSTLPSSLVFTILIFPVLTRSLKNAVTGSLTVAA